MRKLNLHAENISNIVCMHKAGMSCESITAHIEQVIIAEDIRRKIAKLEWQLGDAQHIISMNKTNYNLEGVSFL
jgi:hypothetical protein